VAGLSSDRRMAPVQPGYRVRAALLVMLGLGLLAGG
jgi:hypothetical protein